jgi:hypothetical protein
MNKQSMKAGFLAWAGSMSSARRKMTAKMKGMKMKARRWHL